MSLFCSFSFLWPEYADVYMPLTDSGNTNMSADNSRTYALLLKSEKDDNSSEYVNQLQALRPSFQRHDEI